jgi:hypothetical protein
MITRTQRLLAVLIAASVASLSGADTKLTEQHADSFSKKLGTISGAAPKKGTVRRTIVTESELNSWLLYRAQPLIPKGVTEPTISAIGPGKLSGRATVDLDEVSKTKSQSGGMNPWRFLSGKVPLTVSGTLTTKDGVGQFELESAQVSSVPVPKFLLQQLLTHYSRSATRPDGVSLDAPFQLPANIRQIEVGQGQAVIVQ